MLEHLFDDLAKQEGVATVEGILSEVSFIQTDSGTVTVFKVGGKAGYFSIGVALPLSNGYRAKVAYAANETPEKAEFLPKGLKYRMAFGLQQLDKPNGKPLFTYALGS